MDEKRVAEIRERASHKPYPAYCQWTANPVSPSVIPDVMWMLDAIDTQAERIATLQTRIAHLEADLAGGD